jgi:hypothetical protein
MIMNKKYNTRVGHGWIVKTKILYFFLRLLVAERIEDHFLSAGNYCTLN